MSLKNAEIRLLYEQNFEDIRSQCLEERRLFEDPTFPASQGSFYANYDPMQPRVAITWLRPGEISDSPVLVADGASRFDSRQGNLGNCWFAGSVSSFAAFRLHSKRAFNNIVPEDQGFDGNYAGIFRFRFWQYGEWVEVVVDDRLPTKQGELCSLSSTDENEYWTALLEKAYAKLNGSYEALDEGDGSEGLVDLTGSFSAIHRLDSTEDFFDAIMKAYKEKALIGCSTGDEDTEKQKLGLIPVHYYSVTCVRKVPFYFLGEKGNARMLRLRNPWGNDAEWEGPGNDESLEWNYIPKNVKDSMNLKVEEDGEFWIPYKHLVDKFQTVEICRMYSDVKKNMKIVNLHGTWLKGYGDAKNLSVNPYHAITTTKERGQTSMHIYLMEKGRREKGRTYQELSIYVCRALDNEVTEGEVIGEDDVVAKATFWGREVQISVKLDPLEQYMVVPVRENTEEDCGYLLRIVHDKPITITED